MTALDPTLSKITALRFQAESILQIANRLFDDYQAQHAPAPVALPSLLILAPAPPKPTRVRGVRTHVPLSERWTCPRCARELSWNGHWKHEIACAKPPKPVPVTVTCLRCTKTMGEAVLGVHMAGHRQDDGRREQRAELARQRVAQAQSISTTKLPAAKAGAGKPDRTRDCPCGGKVLWDRQGGQCGACLRHFHRWILSMPVGGVVTHACPCGVTKDVQTEPEMGWNADPFMSQRPPVRAAQ